MVTNDLAPDRSRFKDTPVFFKQGIGQFFGLLEMPPELADLKTSDYRAYAVESADEGFPDRIAVRTLGNGTEDLWWVILAVNGIIDPEVELYAGRIIRVPPISAVRVFLSRL